MKNSRKVWHVFAFIGVFAVFTAVIMLLWNAIIPQVIGWESISYLQAAGLLVLSKLLLGGFGGPFMGGHFMHGKCMRTDPRHAEFHDRLRGMNFNERREFIRERMKEKRCDFFDCDTKPEDGQQKNDD